MKRYAVTPYSLAQMQKRSGLIESMIMLFMEHLDSYADKGVCDLGNLLHYFAFDVRLKLYTYGILGPRSLTTPLQVLGEVAFSRRFGFLEKEMDIDGSIKDIDDVQLYDGIVGHIPEFDILLRNNPLRPYLPFWKPSTTIMTKIAQEELARRKRSDGSHDSSGIDLLAELLRAHDANPEKFSVSDVFSIAHGAVYVHAH